MFVWKRKYNKNKLSRNTQLRKCHLAQQAFSGVQPLLNSINCVQSSYKEYSRWCTNNNAPSLNHWHKSTCIYFSFWSDLIKQLLFAIAFTQGSSYYCKLRWPMLHNLLLLPMCRKINFLRFYFLHNLLLASKLICRGKGEWGGWSTPRPCRLSWFIVSYQPATYTCMRAGGH